MYLHRKLNSSKTIFFFYYALQKVVSIKTIVPVKQVYN